jgi:hypothetical protein
VAVVVSGALLLAGIGLLLLILATMATGNMSLSVLIYPGFAALISSPLVLISAFAVSLIPTVNAQLQDCQH